MRKKESDRVTFSPLREWPFPPILSMVSTYGHYTPAGMDYRYGSRFGARSPDILSTISGSGRRSTDTVSTMSDRYTRAVTSPPRGGICDPVVVNAGFTFRLTDAKAMVHNHVQVDPASLVPQTQSSNLTKEIDKFLKKSDHTLDRFKEIARRRTPPPKPPRTGSSSLNISIDSNPYKDLLDSDSSQGPELPPKSPPGSCFTKGPTPPPKNFTNLGFSKGHSPSLLVPKIPSPSITIPKGPSPSLTIPKRPSPCSISPNSSIAEQAERHRRILSKVMKRGRGKTSVLKEDSTDGSSTSSSTLSLSSSSSTEDDFEYHSGPISRDKSDDTSAEISKLDDLSSGSDEEFFDVQPIPGYFCIPGQPQIRPLNTKGPIVAGSLTVTSSIRTPLHSYSLPAVNKLHPASKMGNKQPYASTQQGKGSTRKYPAPPPPVSREPSLVSIVSLDHKKYPAPPPPMSREASFVSLTSEGNRQSLDSSFLSTSIDSASLNGDFMGSLKKLKRDPSFKKYPAPRPPQVERKSVDRSSCNTPINTSNKSSPQSVKKGGGFSARSSPSRTPTNSSPSRTPTNSSPSRTPTNSSPSRTSTKSSPSRAFTKSSPQSVKKFDSKRPGSPVPHRAMLPLKKNSDSKPVDQGSTNFSKDISSSIHSFSSNQVSDSTSIISTSGKSSQSVSSNNCVTGASTETKLVNSGTSTSNLISSYSVANSKNISCSTTNTTTATNIKSSVLPKQGGSIDIKDKISDNTVVAKSAAVNGTINYITDTVASERSTKSLDKTKEIISKIDGLQKRVTENKVCLDKNHVNEFNKISERMPTSSGEIENIKNTEITKSDSVKVDSLKTDSENVNGIPIDSEKNEDIKSDYQKIESITSDSQIINIDGITSDSLKIDSITSNLPKIDSIGSDSPKIDSITSESSKIDNITSDSQIIDSITSESEKIDNRKVNSDKTDSTKSDSAEDGSVKKVKKKKKLSDGRSSSVVKDSGSDRSSRGSSVTSSRGVTPDRGLRPAPRKSVSGKLAALANKFEIDESSERSSRKVIKPLSKVSEFPSKIGGDKPDIKVGKLVNPYSKPFSPVSNVFEKKSSIGGIDISKFGGLGKPRKTKKEGEDKMEEEEKTTKIKKSSIENKVADTEDKQADKSEVVKVEIKDEAVKLVNKKSGVEKKESFIDTENKEIIKSKVVKVENKDEVRLKEKDEKFISEQNRDNKKEIETKNKELIPNASDSNTVSESVVATTKGTAIETSLGLTESTLPNVSMNNNLDHEKISSDVCVVINEIDNSKSIFNEAVPKIEAEEFVPEASIIKNDAPESVNEDSTSKIENEQYVNGVDSTVKESFTEAVDVKNECPGFESDAFLVKRDNKVCDSETLVQSENVEATANAVATGLAQVCGNETETEIMTDTQINDKDKGTDTILRDAIIVTTNATDEIVTNTTEEIVQLSAITNEENFGVSKNMLVDNIPADVSAISVSSTEPVTSVSSNSPDKTVSTIDFSIPSVVSSSEIPCIISSSSVSVTTSETPILTSKKDTISVFDTPDFVIVNSNGLSQNKTNGICEDFPQLPVQNTSQAPSSIEVSLENSLEDAKENAFSDALCSPSPIPEGEVLVENSIPAPHTPVSTDESSIQSGYLSCETASGYNSSNDNVAALETNVSEETSKPLQCISPITSKTITPLSTPYVKQFIDMSRSPSEMIISSTKSGYTSFNQKSQSLLQKVSDLFQTFYLKDPKVSVPASAISSTSVPFVSNDAEEQTVTKDEISEKEQDSPAPLNQPGQIFSSENLCDFSKDFTAKCEEVKREFESYKRESSEEGHLNTELEIDHGALSVRPKVRKGRENSVPLEALNLSDILRDVDERLSRAMSKPLETTNDEEAYINACDPSHFDTLMPLPNVEEINLIDKRSRSSTPFLDRTERSPTPKRVVEETEAILAETDRLLRKSRSQHSLRRSFTKSLSGANLNRLTEVTADLAEEHGTAQLASERIEAEQSERMRLEKEIALLQVDVKKMSSVNDKLEMEKLSLRNEMLQHVELNGDVVDDEASDISLYKRKYDWAMREMDVLKKQLKQQQEDDLDQLIILKKQLEKKVTDAYEETDEQRQVVAQMKKKSQRLQAEMNDMKILLEEQTSRNNLLEKKQRKFDQEMQAVIEEQRNERLAKEKIQRERDQILSEKYSFEQEVSTLKLELDIKEEKVSALTRELSDLNFTGKAEEEVALLKKAKHDLELRVKDQEEELDDLAGQVQMLESARVRLEMSIEQMRKENRKELSQRDEELEEVRLSAQKKIKALELQLESEHEERTGLVREKHDLERRLVVAHSRSFSSVDEDSFHRVKKELKKTKALLKDTQTMLEKSQSEGSNKLLMRQLKTQLEDAEFAKNAAIKARQSVETDFGEIQNQLEEALRAKKDVEDKLARASKEKSDMQTQLEESEEEVAEVMKKYKATVSQLSVDQITISEQAQLVADLEHDKQVLQDKLTELTSKVEVLEGETANIHTQRRLQMKIKEVESKLDLELTTRQRLESQITRLKDQVERMSSECDSVRMKESQAVDHGKKLNRQLREAKEDLNNLQQKLTDASSRKQEVEKQHELAESEIITLKSDLKLAFKRIEDLQQALQGDLSDSDSEISESKHDGLGGPSLNELMAVIKEDAEDDYKESFA